MSILGQGAYDVAPEVVEISGEVVTRGDTLAEARDPHPEAAAAVRAVIDQLVAEDGLTIKSARYSLREDYPFRYDTSPTITEEQRLKVVYEATTSFVFSTRNLAEIEEIVSTLAESDLRIGFIHFDVDDSRGPLLEARKDAARDALSQAQAYAEALNMELVEILNVRDGDASPPDGAADLSVMTDPYGRIPLSIVIPETLSYWARVNVTWIIRQKK